jgi:Flp pilus assembly protein TadG
MKRRATVVRNKKESGNALLEFALGFSVLWALFAGIYQFGYSFYVYNCLLTAVQDAAELGSKMTYDTANSGQFTTALENMVVYGDTAAGTTPIVPGLTTSNVSVTTNLQGGIPLDVTVSISNFSLNALFNTFNFNGKPRATTVYMGQVTCSTC